MLSTLLALALLVPLQGEAPTHYMGREIARTMHYSAGDWLLREERGLEERPDLLHAWLDVRPGQTVADVGCGNGYHTLRFAEAVGPAGRVWGVELQGEYLGELSRRATEAGLDNVLGLACSETDPRLPPASCDLIFLADVYHEMSHPAEVLAGLRRALKPTGRLVLVEFRAEDPDVPIKRLHKMSRAQILKELSANGFTLVDQTDELPRQHAMAFVRSETVVPGVEAPPPVDPVPSPRQLAWHERTYYAFVHFNMNTFTDVEWGEGREDPTTFHPTELDCRQWARVARDAGMSGIILTAKHHDGFCLWDSAHTEHDVASSAWRDGRGDVLADLSAACREFGLGFGVYLSPWDRNNPLYGDSPAYNAYFRNQLTEVLTSYGEVFEVWFDGACGEGPNGKRQVYDWPSFVGVVREHAPNAVIFSDAGPDIRWVGNERGFSAETSWGTLLRDELEPGTPRYAELTEGHENGTHWVPAEADVSIRPGWYYHPDQDDQVKSLEHLLEIWHGSVGRNANLLLNLPVDRRGLVHENDAARLMELRAALDAIYAEDLARGAGAHASSVHGGDPRFAARHAVDGDPATYWTPGGGGAAASLVVELGRTVRFDRVVLEEHLPLGQRVRSFGIDVRRGMDWERVATGTTIGNKRILILGEPVEGEALRLEVLDGKAAPALENLELYLAP